MSITWLIVSITRLDQISSKIWHMRVFSKYILAVMADKSDEEIQIMEGFTSTSNSDNRRCESIILTIYTHI